LEFSLLNGELEEEIYMEMPEGFEKREKECKLEKSLYGLKQSSRVWHKKISSFLVEEGYLQSEADPCVFIKHHQDCISIIALYVDDCMIFGAKENVDRAKSALSSQFKMKDLGEVKSIIGIQVERDKEETRIHQINYIRDVLKKFGMSDCKGVDTPLPTKKETTNSPIFENITLYQEAIGALNYLATNTIPDIAYAVSQVAQKMKEPNQDDWIKVKRIMRYLKKTESAKLTYKVKGSELIGYSDASYAEEKNRKSTSGYAYLLNGAAISWRSKKQPIVALSSMEAEYIALASATKEGISLKKLEKD
jgi:hypothetical protein